jgi:hypothetical protein
MVRADYTYKNSKQENLKRNMTMQTIHGNGSHSKKSSHRLAGISSMVGTTIEWYDFLFMVLLLHSFLINYFFQTLIRSPVYSQLLQPTLLDLLVDH